MTKDQCLELIAPAESWLDSRPAPSWAVDGVSGQGGDQDPVTVANSLMDAILVHLVGPQWAALRAMRDQSVSTHCREYPGVWVRAIISALKG
jgi:hypothetical protein